MLIKSFLHKIEIILLLEKGNKVNIQKAHNGHRNQGLIIPTPKTRRKDEEISRASFEEYNLEA